MSLERHGRGAAGLELSAPAEEALRRTCQLEHAARRAALRGRHGQSRRLDFDAAGNEVGGGALPTLQEAYRQQYPMGPPSAQY